MSTFPQITSPPQASAEVLVNRMGETLEHQAVYGLKQSTTTALTWGYYGGRWGGFAITAGTLTLTDDSANYIVVAIATGVASVSTATTNWDDDANYVRVYKVTAASGAVTAVEDHRAGPLGVHGRASGGGGGGTDMSTVTALSSSSGVVNLDCSLGDYYTLALTENVTSITFSNLPGSGHGASKMIRITQDSTARTVAWPASFKWAGGSAGAVSTGSGAVDVLAISTFDAGATWRATLAKAFA